LPVQFAIRCGAFYDYFQGFLKQFFDIDEYRPDEQTRQGDDPQVEKQPQVRGAWQPPDWHRQTPVTVDKNRQR
jgi:hypothetical protein